MQAEVNDFFYKLFCPNLYWLGIGEVEERVALSQLVGTGLGAEIAVGAVVPCAFETGAEVERADIIASVAVGAGFFGIGKLHGPRSVGLQQHLD